MNRIEKKILEYRIARLEKKFKKINRSKKCSLEQIVMKLKLTPELTKLRKKRENQ